MHINLIFLTFGYCFTMFLIKPQFLYRLHVDTEQEIDSRLLFKWKRLLPAKFSGMNEVENEQDEKMVLHNQVNKVLACSD